MRDLALYADGGAWDSLWVYDHFHTVPVPTHEATHEAWSLMYCLRRNHVADQARPDVPRDDLPQPGVSRQGRRHRRHHLRRPGPDGHRRRLVRARVAGLWLRPPPPGGGGPGGRWGGGGDWGRGGGGGGEPFWGGPTRRRGGAR